MAIHVKYFANLRQQLGRAEDYYQPSAPLNVAQLWQQLWPQLPLPSNTLVAVNQHYAELEQLLQDQDEVAFFPPVTGG